MNRLLVLAVFGISILSGGAARSEEVATLGRIERLDPAFDRLVGQDAAIELLAANQFEWAEGPVWDRADKRVLFSDIPRNMIWEWSQTSGLKEFLKPSGYTGATTFTGREPGSNGLAFNKAGELVMCQHGDRRIAKWVDGKFVTLADRYAGQAAQQSERPGDPLERRRVLHRSSVRLAQARPRIPAGSWIFRASTD